MVPVCGMHVYMCVHVSVYDTYIVCLHMHKTCMYLYGTCHAMVIGSIGMIIILVCKYLS